MSGAYYNENDPHAAAWLRELIRRGLIADGEVDTRSIEDVRPIELRGYTQCHFFAGIGGWSRALRLAGWPDDERIWTGSCPCQPFSSAGAGNGFADQRHLWPAWLHLIAQCGPPVIVGEQVASASALQWWDLVSADLEGQGYACAAADLCAAGIGAPHIRQRLFWVGDSFAIRHSFRHVSASNTMRRERSRPSPMRSCGSDGLADADVNGRSAYAISGFHNPERDAESRSSVGRLGDTSGEGTVSYSGAVSRAEGAACVRTIGDGAESAGAGDWAGPLHGFWRAADWLGCRDGRWRPVEPGTFPLVDGISANLDRVRAIEVAGWKEIEAYASESEARSSEVVRMVRSVVCEEAIRQRQDGRFVEFQEAALLLDFLLCVEAARDGAANRRGIAQESTEAKRRIVRGVRPEFGSGCTPREWQPDGQLSDQPPDTLHLLPLILARHALAYREAARSAHAASGRAGMLRGYGNAIVPQAAAEFVAAYLDARAAA